MTIDLVIGSLQVGGAERQIVGLAKGLKQLSIGVRVIALFDSSPLAQDLAVNGIPFEVLSSGSQKRSGQRASAAADTAIRLAQLWRRSKPDGMQAWLPEAQILALPVARLLRIPTRVMALRSMFQALDLTLTERIALKVASRCATVVTGNSRAVTRDPNWPGNPDARILVRNGLSLPQWVSTPGLTPARGVCVANLSPIKGHVDLLSALSRVPRVPKMDLVGSGALLTHLKAETRRLDLDDRVAFHTEVTDPLPFLLQAQFFVLPSPSEGMPNALMEAMAAGLPVVAFRVGGIPEIVEDGVSGLLVDPGDVQGLAEAIERVTNDPEWRIAAGMAARERMKELSWEVMIHKNLEIMRGV